MNNLPEFLTVKELCAVMRISRPTVSRQMKAGKIPAVRPCEGRVLIPRSYVDNFAAEVSA